MSPSGADEGARSGLLLWDAASALTGEVSVYSNGRRVARDTVPTVTGRLGRMVLFDNKRAGDTPRAVVYAHGAPDLWRNGDPRCASSVVVAHGSEGGPDGEEAVLVQGAEWHEHERASAPWNPMAVGAKARLYECRPAGDKALDILPAPLNARLMGLNMFVELDEWGHALPPVMLLADLLDLTDPAGGWSPAWANAVAAGLGAGRPFVPHPQHPERTMVTLALERALAWAVGVERRARWGTQWPPSRSAVRRGAGPQAWSGLSMTIERTVGAVATAAVFCADGCAPSRADAALFDRLRAVALDTDARVSALGRTAEGRREAWLATYQDAPALRWMVDSPALVAALDRAVLQAEAGGTTGGAGGRRM